VLYAVLRCMAGCIVPADIKNDHCWDLVGGGGIVHAFSGLRVQGCTVIICVICGTVLRFRSTPGPLTSDVFSTNTLTNGMKAGGGTVEAEGY
jgi:hypothetical protein